MAFTDLANIAQQYGGGRPQPQLPPQQPQQPGPNDPGGGPPDQQSFTQSRTNPAQIAQAGGVGVGAPEGDPNQAAALENTGANKKDDTNKPAETDYPQPPFEPSIYSRPEPNRGPDKWGQAVPAVELAGLYNQVSVDPDLPPPRQAYSEIQNAGEYLQKFGAPGYGDPAGKAAFLANPLAAILDAFSHGKFSANYTQAALRGIYIRQQEMLEHNQQAWQNHQQFLLGVAPLINRLSFGDPQSVGQARRDLEDYLYRSNHGYLLGRLHNGDIKGVVEALNAEDAQMRRMMAAGTQLKKVSDANEVEKRELDTLGGHATSAGGLGGMFDTEHLPGRGGPSGPQTPTKDQEGGDFGGWESPHDQQIGENLIREGVDQATAKGIMEQAHKALNGYPGDFDLKKGGTASRLIGQATQALGARINKVSNYQDPSMDQEELSRQKQAEIDRIDKSQGNIIRGLKELRINPHSAEMAHGIHRHLVDLASKIYPNWNEGSYDQFQKVWNNANSRESQQLQAGNRAATQAVILTAAINRLKIPEDSTIPSNVWQEWVTQGYTSDPQYAALNEPLRAFASEIVYTQTGRAAVTPVTQFLKEVPLHAGKAQFRTMVRNAMIGTAHTVEQQNNLFRRQTGLSGDAPSADPDAMEIFSAYSRMNPNTGKFPTDAPVELRSVEPGPGQRVPKWMTKDQQYEPMSKQQYDGLKATIQKLEKQNPNDPRLPQLRHELGIAQ